MKDPFVWITQVGGEASIITEDRNSRLIVWESWGSCRWWWWGWCDGDHYHNHDHVGEVDYGPYISHHLAPVIPSGQFFICLRWKYLKFQLKILFLNSKRKKWALICLTKECEWAGVTAANNQMFRAVRSHHRSLNNGKAPLQGNILIIDNSKYLTLFPTRCHWLQGETCAFFRIWSFSNFLLTWNPLSSHGGSCLQKQKQSTLDLRKIRY